MTYMAASTRHRIFNFISEGHGLRVGSLLMVLLLVVGFGAPLMADVRGCVAINDPSKRLACYDKFTKKKTRKGNYVVVMTGLDSGWKLLAETPDRGRPGALYLRTYSTKLWIKTDEETDISHLKELRPAMWFRCMVGKMSGYVDLGIFLDFDRAKIAFKFDKEKSQAEVFKLSNDGKRIVSFSEKRLISRIKKMFGNKKLRARITPIGEKPITVTFDISGLETAMRPLRRACNW